MKTNPNWILCANIKVGDRIIQHYGCSFGTKPNSQPPEDKIMVNGEVVWHEKGWNTNMFNKFLEVAGFVCVGWNQENGHYIYKTKERVEILKTNFLQYWSEGMFICEP